MKNKKLILVVAVFVMLVIVLAGCNKYISLDAPSNITYDGTTIRWNAIDNADGYTLQINGGEEINVLTNSYTYNANKTSFSVTIWGNPSSELTLKDKAPTSKQFTYVAAPTGVNVSEDGTLTWNEVDGISKYEIELVDVSYVRNIVTVESNSYSISSGSFSIRVRGVASNNADESFWSDWSSKVSVSVLAQPTNITYDGERIKWRASVGAKGYKVMINGVELEETYTAEGCLYDSNNEAFSVNVKAIGNGVSTVNSSYSAVQKFVYLNPVTNVAIENGEIVWATVDGADGYRIKINGVLQNQVLKETKYTALVSNMSYEVQIMPISDDATYFSSWSVPKTVMILPTPEMMWNDDIKADGEIVNNITWNAVSGASGYTIQITYPQGNTDERAFGLNERAFGEAFLSVGEYTISIKATASPNGDSYDSKYSAPIKVKRLAAPTAANENFITSSASDVKQGFVVNFTSVPSASGYVLSKDGNELTATFSTGNQLYDTDLITTSVMEEQNINYMVKSKGSVYNQAMRSVVLDSLTSESLSFKITVLAAPHDLSMSGYQLSWTSVDNSIGYSVDVAGTTKIAGSNNFDMSFLESGSYNVNVSSRGNGSNVLPSNYTAALNIIRLDAPANIRIETSDSAEGILGYDEILYANSYTVVFDNNENQVPVDKLTNVNQYISEAGTTAHMFSIANYYNSSGTVYYMTSLPSLTKQFIKLATPTFPEVAFTNTQLLWNAPSNINTSIYTPTYEVYDKVEGGTHYNGEKNGLSMDISKLEGGRSYTFSVKAIGNGSNYINSGKSKLVTIYKLATPDVQIANNAYSWKGVVNTVNYAVYIDGVLSDVEYHESGQIYTYVPGFNQIKTYNVEVYAVGDKGYTTIDSDPAIIEQRTKQLTTPDFSFAYSGNVYYADGTIDITITDESEYATGYSYTIGGNTDTSSEKTYSFTPNGIGNFVLRVYALGGGFDEDGVYYVDSQSRGGNSQYTINLLATPNKDTVELSRDGYCHWTAISGAIAYEYMISIDGGDYQDIQTVTQPNFTMDLSGITTLSVKVRAKGNGTTIISSEWVEQTFNLG